MIWKKVWSIWSSKNGEDEIVGSIIGTNFGGSRRGGGERSRKNNLSALVGDGTKVREDPKFTGVTIGTWKIVDGRGNRLEMACKQLQRHGIDIALLTETKLNGCHTSHAFEYDIFATKCEGQNQGGVALAFRKDRNWHLESLLRFCSNIIKCTLVHDNRQTVLIWNIHSTIRRGSDDYQIIG